VQHDISGDHEIVAVMIGGTVHKSRICCLENFWPRCREIWKHSVSDAGMIRKTQVHPWHTAPYR